MILFWQQTRGGRRARWEIHRNFEPAAGRVLSAWRPRTPPGTQPCEPEPAGPEVDGYAIGANVVVLLDANHAAVERLLPEVPARPLGGSTGTA